MRTRSSQFGIALVLLVGAGCNGSANPFASNAAGPGSFAAMPGVSPSMQVRELENWQATAQREYQQMQAQSTAIAQRNSVLESQFANAQRHAQVQDQHLADVSRRLKDATAQLGQFQTRDRQLGADQLSLDRVNQEKERQLAAARRDVQRLESQLARLEQDLRSSQDKLATAQREMTDAKQTADNLLAANRRRSGATIDPNTNISLPELAIPGVVVRRDGDVLRIPLSSDEIFAPGSVQLTPVAVERLRIVASELSQAYPNQRIGIEGHTDDSPISGAWRDHHHLSSAQAMAIYEFMARQGVFGRQQLHVAGHGSNHPVYSSATANGRRENRRVEIVIYPETVRTVLN